MKVRILAALLSCSFLASLQAVTLQRQPTIQEQCFDYMLNNPNAWFKQMLLDSACRDAKHARGEAAAEKIAAKYLFYFALIFNGKKCTMATNTQKYETLLKNFHRFLVDKKPTVKDIAQFVSIKKYPTIFALSK